MPTVSSSFPWRRVLNGRSRWRGLDARQQPILFEDQIFPPAYLGPWGGVLHSLEGLRARRFDCHGQGSSPVALIDTAILWAVALADADFDPAPYQVSRGGGLLFLWRGDEEEFEMGLGVDGPGHGWLIRPHRVDEDSGGPVMDCHELHGESLLLSIVRLRGTD